MRPKKILTQTVIVKELAKADVFDDIFMLRCFGIFCSLSSGLA